MIRIALLIMLALFSMMHTHAQNRVTLEEAVRMALENNSGLQAAQKVTDQQLLLKDAQKVIDKTNFFYGYDHNNVAENGRALHIFGASQNFKLPGYYQAQDQVGQAKTAVQQDRYLIATKDVSRQVAYFYNEYKYWRSIKNEYRYMDSLYNQLQETMEVRLQVGEGTALEKVSAIAKRRNADIKIRQADQKMVQAKSFLQSLIQSKEAIEPDTAPLVMMEVNQPDIETHPQYLLWQDKVQVAKAEIKMAEQEARPEWNLNLFGGFNDFNDFRFFPGIEAGLSLALWKDAYHKKKEAAQIATEINSLQANDTKLKLENQLIANQSNLQMVKNEIDTYHTSGRALEQEIEKSAIQAYNAGEISFLEYVTAMENASILRQNYKTNLYQYNQYVISINYLINP